MKLAGPCLWFDGKAEEAARYYVSIFPNSRIRDIVRYLEGSPGRAGTVMTVSFDLDGTEFLALNGGPHFKFTPAISFVVHCKTQPEIDGLWDRLSDGGEISQCGWLQDRFGISWQVVPQRLIEMFQGADKAASQRAFTAMLQMRKLDIAQLEHAYSNAG